MFGAPYDVDHRSIDRTARTTRKGVFSSLLAVDTILQYRPYCKYRPAYRPSVNPPLRRSFSLIVVAAVDAVDGFVALLWNHSGSMIEWKGPLDGQRFMLLSPRKLDLDAPP